MAGANYIKKVAIVGAGGNSGIYMTEALLKTGKHTVTAITRVDSNSTLPEGVQVKKVDYGNHSSIVEALQGQDALIITMGVMAPPDQESKLIQAAADASVPWVLPNAWSPDTANEALVKDVFPFQKGPMTRGLITKLGKSSFIAVETGFWYEWSLAISAAYGFDFANRAVTLFDDGETKISTSTWPQVGRAVASLLSLPIHPEGQDEDRCLDRFKNKMVYVSSFTVSQKDMLDSVLRVTQTSLEDWKVTKEPVEKRYTQGIEAMQKGDRTGFAKMMYSRVFYPDGCGNFDKTRGTSNDLLRLPKEDLDEATKAAIQRSKEVPWG
ncbi:NmrA-like domain [Lasallia pustulata]|uniref:NmrA-like domain n=1 Tax=Lasallia pustulata TaxID=136370 RepID=A0A1W5DAV5_9LECA|nr:NmrA-like domain [Lasallia pustulata]